MSKFKYWFPFRFISHRFCALSQTRARALEQFFYFHSITQIQMANCWNALQRTHFSPQFIANATTKFNKSFPEAKVYFRRGIRIDYINLISDRCSVWSSDASRSERPGASAQATDRPFRWRRQSRAHCSFNKRMTRSFSFALTNYSFAGRPVRWSSFKEYFNSTRIHNNAWWEARTMLRTNFGGRKCADYL